MTLLTLLANFWPRFLPNRITVSLLATLSLGVSCQQPQSEFLTPAQVTETLTTARRHWEKAGFSLDSLPIGKCLATLQQDTTSRHAQRFAAEVYNAQIHGQQAKDVHETMLRIQQALERTMNSAYAKDTTVIFEYLLGKSLLSSFHQRLGTLDQALALQTSLLADPNLSQYPLLAAEVHEVYGVTLLDKEQFAQGLEELQQALSAKTAILPNDHLSLVGVYAHLGVAYYYTRQYAKAAEFTQKGIAVLEAHPDEVDWSDMVAMMNNLGAMFEVDYNYLGSMQTYDATDSLLNQFSADTLLRQRADLLYHRGDLYMDLGAYQQASDYFVASADMADRAMPDDAADLAYYHHAAGVALRVNGALEEAATHFRRAIELRKAALGSQSDGLAASYTGYGRLLRERGEYEAALQLLQSAKQIRLASAEADTKRYLPASYSTLGLVYLDQEQYKLAEQMLDSALWIHQAYEVTDNLPATYQIMGQILEKQGQYRQATRYYRGAIDSLTSRYGYYHSRFANHYLGLASTAEASGNIPLALAYLDTALLRSKYRPEALWQQDIRFDYLTKTLYQKAVLLTKLYQAQPQDQTLPQAIDSAYQELFKVLDYYQQYALNPAAKTRFIHERYHWLEAALAHYTAQSNLARCFEIMERSRAIRLRQSYFADQAPADHAGAFALQDHIQTIQREIFLLDKQMLAQRSDTATLRKAATSVARLRPQLQQKLTDLTEVDPDLYSWRYDTRLVDIPSMQRIMANEQQAMLSYFVGDKHVYLLTILPDTAIQTQIPLDFPLQQWVSDLRQSLVQNPARQLGVDDPNLQCFYSNAYQLYQRLIKPVMAELQEYKRLVVLTDGALNLLPFNVLLTQAYDDTSILRDAAFLAREYAISYSYSATVDGARMAQTNAVQLEPQLLILAPLFTDESNSLSAALPDSTLSPLNENDRVLQACANIFAGRVVQPASLTTLSGASADYKIVQIASHAVASTTAKDAPYIVLNKDQSDQLVKVDMAQVSALDLAAELVVLSACATSLGVEERGEGVLSLARAFALAGAQAVVTTQWTVQETPTQQLLLRFYENLSAGFPKDVALQRAQLQLLEANYVHPYYWAGIQCVGLARAVSDQ